MFEKIAPYITPAILLLFLINIGIFAATCFCINRLYRIVHPTGNKRTDTPANMSNTDDDCEKLFRSSSQASFWYTLYANITAIFPLLGIFGTVCSLVGVSGAEDISSNFSVALDTTAWGVLFAMIFKLLDAPIASKLERALDDADYLIHKHDEEKRTQYAAQTKT